MEYVHNGRVLQIADAHTHIYPKKIADKAVHAVGDFYHIPMTCGGTAEDLLASGEQIGTQSYLVCSVATKPEQAASITNFIAEACREHPQFVGLGAYHQDVEDPEGLLASVKTLGLYGIKLHSDFQRCNIDDPKLMPVYKMLCELDLCVLFHMGDDRYDFSSPARLVRVLEKYPHLRCIAAHFGGYQRWKEAKACLAGAGENLYFDTSSSLAFLGKEQAEEMIYTFGPDRMLFGTDFPMWSHADELQRFLSLSLPDTAVDAILSKNFQQFFKKNV